MDGIHYAVSTAFIQHDRSLISKNTGDQHV